MRETQNTLQVRMTLLADENAALKRQVSGVDADIAAMREALAELGEQNRELARVLLALTEREPGTTAVRTAATWEPTSNGVVVDSLR